MRIWLDDLRNPESRFIQETYGAESGMVWVKDGILLLDMLGIPINDRDMDIRPRLPVEDINFIVCRR